MQRAKLNYFVDFLMLIFFLITSITGLVIFFFIPEGVRQGRYQEFAGITKNTWSIVHDYSGILLLIVVIIHLALHWNWIKYMARMLFESTNNDKER